MALVRRAVGWFLHRFGGFELAAEHSSLTPSFLDSLSHHRRFFPDGIFALLQPSPIVWVAVPKKRRSLEKRKSRRFFYKFFESAEPKANLAPCTECGHWIERQYACPHCYAHVRMETEKAKEAFGIDQLKYDWPTSEVSIAYRNENELADRLRKEGKFVLQVDRPRPNWWFGKNLLTKSSK